MDVPSVSLAWVLHYRPYKETSVIADLLTAESGKVSVVASGIRQQNRKGRPRTPLQPFTQLQVSWRGRSELKKLTQADLDRVVTLKGKHLFCGMYANELLMRLLQPHMPVEGVWELYDWLLSGLASEQPIEPHLRLFEKTLLDQLGYALPLTTEGNSNNPINADKYYQFSASKGFIPVANDSEQLVFSGQLLIAYAHNHIKPEMLSALKYLNRMALAPLLGNKPLNSRSLFKKTASSLS